MEYNNTPKVLTDKKEILKALKSKGKVYVHGVMDHEFPIEKQAAINYATHNACELYVWPDGYKKIEAAQ